MRRYFILLLIASLTIAGCRQQSHGAIKVVVIGAEPRLRDPALGPTLPADALMLQSVAQGLVRFDANGNIVPGLAERWNVSDDGLSYIFRLASARWPDGSKITGDQVARLIKRQLAARSRNPLKDSLGAIEDVVAMTDRVVEIQLVAPRPTLLAVLAQPEMAVLRGRAGSGPFRAVRTGGPGGELSLTREIAIGEDQEPRHEQVLLAGQGVSDAVASFVAGRSDLVLGGGLIDLPVARRVKRSADALRFDPASGLFGLVPARTGGALDKPEVRQLLSQALDRANFVSATGVPGLVARATLLEPGLDGIPAPVGPAWAATPPSDRLTVLSAQADRLFGKAKPTISIADPDGPGSDLLVEELRRDWGAIGINVERATAGAPADLLLIDEVAPSASASWYVRRFRCGVAPLCDPAADQLMEAARQSPVPAQRYALLVRAAARIDDAQLFIPITAPVRWSLVSARIQNFAGNRYARHTLTDLEQQASRD